MSKKEAKPNPEAALKPKPIEELILNYQQDKYSVIPLAAARSRMARS